MPTNRCKTRSELSISIKVSDAATLGIWENKVDTHQHACQSHLGKLPSPAQLQKNDLVDFRLPSFFRPPTKILPSNQACLIVVGAIKGRSRMRNIDSDHRNIRLSILGGANGCNFFPNLIFNGQVYLFANKPVSISQSGFRVVTVVCRNDFYPLGVRSTTQTR